MFLNKSSLLVPDTARLPALPLEVILVPVDLVELAGPDQGLELELPLSLHHHLLPSRRLPQVQELLEELVVPEDLDLDHLLQLQPPLS